MNAEQQPEATDEARPTFDALALTDSVRRAIDDMGYVHPTDVQLVTYESICSGRDLIVQARTGTGKTAAFGMPLIDRTVRAGDGMQALILAPTRELALQSATELGRIGAHGDVRTVAVYGGAPIDRQIRQLEDGAEIVSGTPGRVLDHLRRGTLVPDGLKVLVLDEADEILSMGFAKELHSIMELLPKARQTLLFSATVDNNVQRVADRHMTDPEFVGLSSDRVGALTVKHFVYFISGGNRSADLVQVIEVDNPESAIVFCNTKAETQTVAGHLQRAGFDADWLNGDLSQNEREKVMARTREGRLRFLVATDVAARGIDISHLTHVINFSFPPSSEQYVHRTGRTGRAGRTGTAISLISPPELGALYYLRLQFKIFPVERSLPTAGEERTRLEADRVGMLQAAFTESPNEMDRAIARRLMTHPDAERLLAGLLAAFFGGQGDAESVDEQAAAARRSRAPEPAPEPEPEAAPRKRRRRRQEPESEAAATERASVTRPDGEDDAPNAAMTRLYVNVGRRDGLQAGEIAEMMREHAELTEADIGRIRVRDNHTFVEVLAERVEHVISTLPGHKVNDRELVVEPARQGGR